MLILIIVLVVAVLITIGLWVCACKLITSTKSTHEMEEDTALKEGGGPQKYNEVDLMSARITERHYPL